MYTNNKLIEFDNYLEGKKVAIIGLGVSNIPLIDYMHDKGAIVTAFDAKKIDEIDKSVMDKIVNYGMKFYLGDNYLSNLKNYDVIFRSPSCLPTTPELQDEARRGSIVTTEIEMVLTLTPSKVIGVTGSDGKTTTTTLISEILKKDGYNVFLGGNIGTPLFNRIKDMTPEDIVVLELSSFQLMHMNVSPQISVITNITPNHLNVHKDMEEYVDAKKEIYNSQDENGIVVLNYDNEITRKCADEVKGKVRFFSSKEKLKDGMIYDPDDRRIKKCNNNLREHIFDTDKMKLRGVHNFENACAAILATQDLVKKESIDYVLENFSGVEHRLELVKETSNRVKWYNDSVSSSPTRTIAGLNSFPHRNIILIAGGYDKNLDYSVIGKPIVDHCKALILLGATSSKIETAVLEALTNEKKELSLYKCKSLDEVVKIANEISIKGDIVLFSPASASFDMFKNFADRGIKFKETVNKLVD